MNHKSTSRLPDNPFCVSVEQGMECTRCKNIFPRMKLLQCSEANCKRAFCFQCQSQSHFRNNVYLFTQDRSDEMAASRNWKCRVCMDSIEDEIALSRQESNSYLGKKRKRISYKLKQKKNSSVANKPKINSNAQIIHNTIIKLINHSIKKIDKIKEPDCFMGVNKSKNNSEGIFIEADNGNERNNYSNQADCRKKAKSKVSFDSFFPNYERNKQANALIIKSAVVSHSCRVHKGRKKGKACVFCCQYERPNGIEMVKFKKYEDLICFFNIFFSELELYLSKESSLEKDFYKRILKEKEYLFELQDNIEDLKGNMIIGSKVKTFCSNCIANAFRQNIGVHSIFNICYDEEKQLAFKRKSNHDNATINKSKMMTIINNNNTQSLIAINQNIDSFDSDIFSSSFDSNSEAIPGENNDDTEIQEKLLPNKDRPKISFKKKLTSKFIRNFLINSLTIQKPIIEPVSQFPHANIYQGRNNSKIAFQTQEFFPFPIQITRPNPSININTFEFPYTHTHRAYSSGPFCNNASLHKFFRSLKEQYILPLDLVSLVEDNQLKSISSLAQLIEQADESNSKRVADQLQFELSILNAKAKEKAEILAAQALELNEMQKYFGIC